MNQTMEIQWLASFLASHCRFLTTSFNENQSEAARHDGFGCLEMATSSRHAHKKGRVSPAFLVLSSCFRNNQAFLCVARRVQVSTTVSGFSEMLLIP